MALLLEASMLHICTLLWVAASSFMMIIISSAGQPDQGPVVRQLKGPYWVEQEGLERSDVTAGLIGGGLPLELTMQLMAPVRPPPPPRPHHPSIKNIIHSTATDDKAVIPSLYKPIKSNNYVSGSECMSSHDDDAGGCMIIQRPRDDMSNDDAMISPHDDGTIPPNSCPPSPPLRPLVNAQVDIWHCSFDGLYSGAALDSTLDLRWLRGYQKTDTHGRVTFRTIYPGWYFDRTVHIHVRVRLFHNIVRPGAAAAEAGDKKAGEDGDGDKRVRRLVVYDDTTQLYFDDALSDDIYAHVYPYNSRDQERLVRNTNDWHFHPSNLIRNITGDYNYIQNSSSNSAAAPAPAPYKAYVVLRLPFLPLLPPPPYA